MNPLQYTSNEMFSSTELIRKSKNIFDKLFKKDIEKAIILRDGKPAFMLLDFSEYEKIMKEYEALKNMKSTKIEKINEKEKVQEEEISNKIEEENEHLNEKDLEDALAEIDNLDLENLSSKEETTQKEPLKDFWE